VVPRGANFIQKAKWWFPGAAGRDNKESQSTGYRVSIWKEGKINMLIHELLGTWEVELGRI
jgi:hypothetical protein